MERDELLWYKVNEETGKVTLGNTVHFEKKIIEQLKLTKFNGILFQDGQALEEELKDQVYRIMRVDVNSKFAITTTMAKEVADRVKAMIPSPMDNRDLITFNNTTIRYSKTRELDKLVFEPRVLNHNPVLWDYLTKEEIASSPKHVEMQKYLHEMLSGWRVNPKLFFKIGAYTMIKHAIFDKVFYFKGEGGRGKSTAIDMLKALYNENASKTYNPVAPQMAEEIAFVGTQMVYFHDLPDGAQDITHIRPASTGDDIGIRALYQNGKTYKPYATMIFGTNFDVTWKGRSGGNSAAEDRVFIIEFKGEKMRGTDAAKRFKDIDPLKNKYFMDVFASTCADMIPTLIKEEFNDAESRALKSESLNDNDVVNIFLKELDPSVSFAEKYGDGRVYLALYKERYTNFTDLWNYFKAWREDGQFKGTPNKSEFKKQFQSLTGIKVDTLERKMIDGHRQRWIDLGKVLGLKDEVEESVEGLGF